MKGRNAKPQSREDAKDAKKFSFASSCLCVFALNLLAKVLLFGKKIVDRDLSILTPLSLLWGFVSRLRHFLYDRGLFRVHRAGAVVVSIGNIVAGGTGKTPFVHLLASQFPKRRLAILSRGYGPIPDEALLLQKRLPGVRVYVGRDRVLLAKRAVAEGAELILLDDGFQHRRLARDLDVVLLRDKGPFGGGHFLPRGHLRDSPKSLARADFIFVTGSDVGIEKARVLSQKGGEVSILGKKVALFSGIANPKAFRKTVEELGGGVVAEWILGDHGVADLALLEQFFRRSGAEILLCTEKDFVKLSPPLELPLHFLEITFGIRGGRLKWEKLIAKIEASLDNCQIV